MNFLHYKYAVEVADAGSINKAAEHLLMGQPNLSRAIRELEHSLGITIFVRSAKGMEVTPEGAHFLEDARDILTRVEEVERRYRDERKIKQKFLLIAPDSEYIKDTFKEFQRTLPDAVKKVQYLALTSNEVLERILSGQERWGIVRCPAEKRSGYRMRWEEKGIDSEVLGEFSLKLTFNRQSPLFGKEKIAAADLNGLSEVYLEEYASWARARERKIYADASAARRKCVNQWATARELLNEEPSSFMWFEPMAERSLSGAGWAQGSMSEELKVSDVLIRKKGAFMTENDRAFLEKLVHRAMKIGK